MAIEKTFVILKPDCMTRGLEGQVLNRLVKAGFKPVAAKMCRFTEAKCREHYAHLVDKPFFPSIVKFMTSAPVILLVLEGEGAIERVRALCGPTDSRKALPGTIRGDYGVDVQQNIIHASDGLESAEAEIQRFFKKEEMHDW